MATKKPIAKKKGPNKATRMRRLKKACHEAWSRVVRLRDKTCRRCSVGKTPEELDKPQSLAGHHWIVSAARSLQDRYNPANGTALCYGCHIRVIHKEASYANSVALFNTMLETVDESEILAVLLRAGTESPDFKEDDLKTILADLQEQIRKLEET